MGKPMAHPRCVSEVKNLYFVMLGRAHMLWDVGVACGSHHGSIQICFTLPFFLVKLRVVGVA